ncbi:PepSY-associated TM helix domain-containing protein [Idiomarina sp. HP20-50]|uniref:PepSY-associated TM helix domain-containing protein n=1 Tax=Idiomarina sp. HP20-50 TaxID=3070813 RepID=UPI00294B3AA4|nr:PepSY-associated TM helix domain-containing protein [Idiomarina sp. HP20-50]MDV6314829.1 PepSY-associated TM helix domain-containing protein [Idiomarina sp. HP20-50]
MNWLHTWAGLVAGWILFAVFLTGTLAYFQDEITQWMQPELKQYATPDEAVKQAQNFLQNRAPNSSRWSITLPNDRATTTILFWRDPNAGGRGFKRAALDGNGNEVALRDTRGGSFLYRFHFDLHYMPVFWARWLIGICAMFMLVAIVTGIVIHKKIFKDFFTFQTGKGPRSWLDGHTITSVLALPFHFMITYTGLVTLMIMYMSSAISLSFGDRGAFFQALESQVPAPQVSGQTAPLTNLQTLYFNARESIGDKPISFISVVNPGDKNATVSFHEAATSSLMSNYSTLTYSAVSGKLLSAKPVLNNAELTRRTMIGLHAGRFAGIQLRWLYFFSGILGTLMVATGLVLWFESRKKKLKAMEKLSFGHHLVSGLNAGFIMGLPFAVAVYFLSNRLLPVSADNRAELEISCFFFAWLFMVCYPLLRGSERTWRDGALFNGITFLALPVVSVFTVGRHIFNYQYPRDWPLLGIDISLWVTALIFLALTRYLFRNKTRMESGK